MTSDMRAMLLKLACLAGILWSVVDLYNMPFLWHPSLKAPSQKSWLLGTHWRQYQDAKGLGYDFISMDRVNLLLNGVVIGQATYVLDNDKVIIVRSRQADMLVMRQGQLHWMNRFPPPKPFNMVQ